MRYLKISVPCCRWFGRYSITAKDDVHLIEIFFFWGWGALRGRDNDNNDDDDWDNDPDDYLHFHVFPKVLALDLHGGTVKLLGSFLQDKKNVIQWGLEYLTGSDFKRSKAVWLVSGWAFFGCRLLILCTGSVFKWSVLGHSCSYSPDHSETQPFRYQCTGFWAPAVY